jgi:hypothetical protein
MVALAKQLIDRQTTTYDPSDLEDRYETRLRAMIDAAESNVIDLMVALKKSLSQEVAPKKAAQSLTPAKPKRAAAAQAAKPGRKRASQSNVSSVHRFRRILLRSSSRHTPQTNS